MDEITFYRRFGLALFPYALLRETVREEKEAAMLRHEVV